MRLSSVPAAPHVTVDNRLTAAEPLAAQIEAIAARRSAGYPEPDSRTS
jgi:hypothetical protein